jgi:hypothetical protein
MNDLKSFIRRRGITNDEDVKLLTSYFSNKAKSQYLTITNNNGRADIIAIARRLINNEDLDTILRLIKRK